MQSMTGSAIDLARELAQVRAEHCVTIYGPLEPWIGRSRAVAETNAMAAIERQLHAAGATEADASPFRDRLREVEDAVAGVDLAAFPSVAILATAGSVTVRPLSTRPAPVLLVSDRFLIGPLLAAALSTIPPVFVLALSAGAVRLIDATTQQGISVSVAGLPVNLEETIRLDLTGDRQSLAHLLTSEDPKERLREYSRAIDAAVEPVLRSSAPLLVLAGAEPLVSIFKAVARYPDIAADIIAGNHDEDTVAELTALAAPIADRERDIRRKSQLGRFAAMPSRDRALTELRPVVQACQSGAVDTLLVDVDRRSPIPSQASTMATTLDLVDEAVRAALDTGATIVPVRSADLPTMDPVAAVLRYPHPVPLSPATGMR